MDFLTRAGHLSDDRRQELILLSDVLGRSMLTVSINQGAGSQATEPTVFGPFTDDDIVRPAHIHVMISAPGRRTLITHVFDREDPYLATAPSSASSPRSSASSSATSRARRPTAGTSRRPSTP